MKRVLLVPDVGPPTPWAWWYRAKDIQSLAPFAYQVDVLPHNSFVDRYQRDPGGLADYNAVFSFSWTMSPLDILRHARRSVCLCTCSGLFYDRRIEGDWRSRVVTASRCAARAKERLPRFDGVIAVNSKLYDACKQHNPNTVLIPSGVNTYFWQYEYMRKHDGRLRVGWCGQRRCNVKGQREILEPLMKRCPQYDWRVNDRNFDKSLSREEMRNWYHGLDVFVSTSIIEGTPSPPFEAASCGRVVLSTDVGVVSDWLYLGQRELRAPAYYNQATADKTVEWFAGKLAELERYAKAGRLERIGLLLRQSVKANYCYAEAGIAKRYLEFIANGKA